MPWPRARRAPYADALAAAGVRCLLVMLLASPLLAEELLPRETPIAAVIDHYVDASLQAAGLPPAPQADDATLVRRLTLDLAGRIPTRNELNDYLASPHTEKRDQLVDRLIHSRWYVRHLATTLNTMLRGSGNDGPDLREYLLVAVAERRSWDQMFRELMGTQAAPHDPQRFVHGRVLDQDLLTRDVSSIFLGINISCAQCHVHPYVDTLTQDHFFGMRAFFARSYLFEDRLLERQFAEPQVKYTTNDGEAREVGPTFLTGATIELTSPTPEVLAQAIADEQKRIDELKKENEERKKRDPKAVLEYPADAPLSVRQRFVELALQQESASLLARSLINRLWHHYFGYGLVMRVDQMHSANPPSHPQLLDWLARDLQEHHYDFHRTIHGIVSSRSYSRASRSTAGAPPARSLFALANLRPLTPMQFGVSLLTLGDTELFSTGLSDTDLDAQIATIEQQAQQHFAELIEQPYDDLQINATEALGISNDPARLQVIGAKLATQLATLSDRRDQLHGVVESVLSRPLETDEAVWITEYVVQAEAEQAAAVASQNVAAPAVTYSPWQQVIWALSASAEFRFNH